MTIFDKVIAAMAPPESDKAQAEARAQGHRQFLHPCSTAQLMP
jgi:hypothetical protein